MKYIWSLSAVLLVLLVTAVLFAPGVVADSAVAEAGTAGLNTTDMLWVAVASCLVFAMAPAIALFYGGMLRKQSMTSIIAQCTVAIALVGFIWMAVGYSLAFSGSGDFVGNLNAVLLNGVPADASTLGYTIPDMEFMLFQGMFALVTACIVLGAAAERVRFPAIMIFLTLWSLLVYVPMAHMVWGGGLLSTVGGYITTLDYAGGTVVHICSGISGVAVAVVVGRRHSSTAKYRSHNVPAVYLGAALLWIGWIGFNGGSGLAVNAQLINVITVTVLSSFVSTLVWCLIQYIYAARISVTSICAGMLAGLVGITPACGYVTAPAAIIIGAVAAVVCYVGVLFMRKRSGVDDALDVFGIHGLGGIWGAIATGIFASQYTDTGGLMTGSTALFCGQLIAVAFTLIYCFAVSYVIMKVISKIMRVRLTEEEEQVGADIIEHGESAYD